MSSSSPRLSEEGLLTYFKEGEKPASQARVGCEHELFIFDEETFQRLPYERIRELLQAIGTTDDWSPVLEKGVLIGLNRGASNISLEPGGQLELSGAPYTHLHDMVDEIETYHDVLRSLKKDHRCVFLALGLDPFSTSKTVPWMPKERYTMMRAYMPSQGSLGLEMMGCSSTVQINLDYSSEVDMQRKLHVAFALQPIISAFFVSSSLREGRDSGWASFRQHIWTDTDPDRCGIPEPLFGHSAGYASYRDYALDIPMYFLQRESYVDIANTLGRYSFRDFLQGRIPSLSEKTEATVEDWANHLSTLFPEVRLKQYLEMRSADSVPPPLMYGLGALWVGLLYDTENLEVLTQDIASWSYQDVMALRSQVARQGWHQIIFKDRPLQEWCRDLLQRAHQGLERRAFLKNHQTESLYLRPLFDRLACHEHIADVLRQDIHLLQDKNLRDEALRPWMI